MGGFFISPHRPKRPGKIPGMNFERNPSPKGSFDLVKDKALGRIYVQCGHCSGYRPVGDMIANAYRTSALWPIGTILRYGIASRTARSILGFAVKHAVCAAIKRGY